MASGLANSRVVATLPVGDLQRAKRFYSEKLGLTPMADDPEGVFYELAGGTILGLFPTRGHSGSDHTEVGFIVDDLSATMSDLKSRGVTFEEYDFADLKTENAVASLTIGIGAWFKDSEGNILALTQFSQSPF